MTSPTIHDNPEALIAANLSGAMIVDVPDHFLANDGQTQLALDAYLSHQLALGAQHGFARVWFRFALADGSGPTLFAPVGKFMRAAIKDGTIMRAAPAENGGWIVRISPDATAADPESNPV